METAHSHVPGGQDVTPRSGPWVGAGGGVGAYSEVPQLHSQGATTLLKAGVTLF